MVNWLQKIIEEQTESGLSMEQANELMQVIDREHVEAGLCIPQGGITEISQEDTIKSNRKYDVALYGAPIEESYGGLITYYALYKAVERKGYSVGLILPPQSEDTEKMKSHIMRFCEEYMHTCEQLPASEMKQLYEVADAFLVGSDQIWNYTHFPDKNETVYLNFLKNKKKKIAYGASFGAEQPTIFPDYEEKYPKIMAAIHRFDAISVSESSGIDICTDYYGTEATKVLDSVFLLNKKDYQELTKKAKNKSNNQYICAYKESSVEGFENISEMIAEQMKLPCVQIDNDNIQNYQVEDWLSHIMNSEFVVTDSYYGVCLSVIFKKQFIVVQNAEEVTRIDALLKELGLENRFVHSTMEFMERKEICLQNIDYDKVNKTLNREIYTSQNWLKRALSAKKRIHCRDKMAGVKVKDEAYEQMYTIEDASAYFAVLDSLKEDIIISIVKKGKKDGNITKVNFFEDGDIGQKSKEKAKSTGFAYIYDFENEAVVKKLKDFSFVEYYWEQKKFICYSEGKSYDKNKKKTAEFIIEQADKKDIYRTSEDGLYVLIYSKIEDRVIDYVYINISKGSQLQIEHLLN